MIPFPNPPNPSALAQKLMAQNQIKSLRPQHSEIMRWIIANPTGSNADCAVYFGVSQSWLSVVVNSDLFQARLAQLQIEMDSQVTQSLGSKITTAAHLAIDNLTRELETNIDPEFALDATEKLLKAKGYGGQKTASQAPVHVQVQNVTSVDRALLKEIQQELSVNRQDLPGTQTLLSAENSQLEEE